jgi:excinuclease ABC subunit C
MRADLKTRALIDSIWGMETHTVRSEPESILLEGKLIKEYRPKYNISFRDDKRFLLVKVDLSEPFPRFRLTRLKKDDGCRYFGPFAHAGALRSTLNLLKKKFHLRSCRPEIPTETDYKHCLDHIIKKCSAPCVNRIQASAYKLQVEAACDFLEGQTGEFVKSLEQAMKEAAAKLDFEKAAELRNMLDDLKKTTEPRKRFTRAFASNVSPVHDLESLRDALQLPVIPAVIECFDISNISNTHKVASMVAFKNGAADKANYRRYRIRTVAGQDDFASMAEVVHRRYSRIQRESGSMPDLVVVDGGKGQLSAARRSLEALGLFDQPIIGLAKQREEIFRPMSSAPLVLPHDTGAIRLLQRIRDEAHRFANGYHQLLLKKRISESVLDDIPGISQRRKLALLQALGSADAVRRASPEALAEVEGISPNLAQAIVQFFERRRLRRNLPDADAPPAEPFVYRLKTN